MSDQTDENHICGCGENAARCRVSMDEDREFCCHCCDHVHTLQTLKMYGLLNR